MGFFLYPESPSLGAESPPANEVVVLLAGCRVSSGLVRYSLVTS